MIVFHSALICSLVALCSSQYRKPSKDAAILSEARYLAVNGEFGAAYKQEDGVEFNEESDGQGNRRGSYSYVDPSGIRRTVHYTAGKDGFKATGDHIPVPPPAVAATVSASVSDTDNDYYDDSNNAAAVRAYQPVYNYNNNYQFVASNSPAPPPPPAPPSVNSFNHPASSPFNVPPAQSAYNPSVQFQYRAAGGVAAPAAYGDGNNAYAHVAETSTRRFLPPGKLSVNRSPDGFSYTFNKI